MQIQALWQKTLDVLAQRMNKASYGTFVTSLQPLDLNGNELTLQAPNEFTLKWVAGRHRSVIEAALTEVAGHPVTVCVRVGKQISLAESAKRRPAAFAPEEKGEVPVPPVAPVVPLRRPGLNPKWTFATLVVGHNNRFAHAAALAVSQHPGEVYNPLVLHGGVGLGKTHLMHAVGHEVLRQFPESRIIYIRAEKFTKEMAMAYKEGRGLEFQNRFRHADLLLVDDIHFMGNKERTQEEFFYTFTTLYEAGKQIILSSDRPLRDICNLEARLRSRFESGLLAEIGPPDLETRVAILRKKASLDGLEAPDPVLEYIADTFPANVRELEGAFIRVMAFASLQGHPVTRTTAQRALKGTAERTCSIAQIQDVVAGHYGVSVEDLKSRKRTRQIAFARQVAMYVCRELTENSFLNIGMAFGGRDHSTAHHACRLIEAHCREQPAFQSEMEQLIGKIKS